MNLPVHSQWHPQNSDYRIVETGLNIYHLKNIEPENRTARKKLYNSLDPDRKIQAIGYDYLDNEDGLQLTPIPASRLYKPSYKNDYNISQLGDKSSRK